MEEGNERENVEQRHLIDEDEPNGFTELDGREKEGGIARSSSLLIFAGLRRRRFHIDLIEKRRNKTDSEMFSRIRKMMLTMMNGTLFQVIPRERYFPNLIWCICMN